MAGICRVRHGEARRGFYEKEPAMATYSVESMDLYEEVHEGFIRRNGRKTNDLDKAALQGEVILRLILRLEEKVERIEEKLDRLVHERE
jgi:hypothetical protein